MILIKSKKEIDFIRESSKIVAETLQLVKRYVKPGISTLELDKIAEVVNNKFGIELKNSRRAPNFT